MKNEMILSNGVKIEFVEDGVNVISANGELIHYNDAGEISRIEGSPCQKGVEGYSSHEDKEFEMIGSGLCQLKGNN
jgi:hypothetical protein